MGWIRRSHQCPMPADGRRGDLWECDTCTTRWAFTLWGWWPVGARHDLHHDESRGDTTT